MNTHTYSSPIGSLHIAEQDGYITEISFLEAETRHKFKGKPEPSANNIKTANNPTISTCIQELDAYFAGQLQDFTVPIKLTGTPFRKRVWDALMTIPYGQTISYKQLAMLIGQPTAMRAVGGANHNNPISIIVPCHRVIGANGKLTGYGGGLSVKEFLLEHERKVLK